MSLGIMDKNFLLRHIDKSMILEEPTHAVDAGQEHGSLQKLVGLGIRIKETKTISEGAIIIESFKFGREES
jgi:hypothetical protein